MTTVFIAQHSESAAMAKKLFSVLSSDIPCALCCCGQYDFSAESPEICIVECRENANITSADKSISLMLCGCGKNFSPPIGSTVLTFGALPADAGEKRHRQLISCGLGSRNTVTLSSLGEYRSLLSVQRTITALDGSDIDIGEYPVSCEESDRTAVIASAVIALLHFGVGASLDFSLPQNKK